jgi:hypothetical protein
MIEENDSIFREQQKFSPWLRTGVFFSVAITVAVLAFAEARQGMIGQPSSILSLLAGILLMLAITALFWNLRLETEVRADGLYVRFFPFHLRYKKFTPQELSEHYARQYRPLLEYGGWGIKYGRKGWAYNVSGNMGVQLVFKNGKKLLIGSQKAQELAEAMNSIVTSL